MLKKKIKWFGIDCGSADHSMNTSIRLMRPDSIQPLFNSSRERIVRAQSFVEGDEIGVTSIAADEMELSRR